MGAAYNTAALVLASVVVLAIIVAGLVALCAWSSPRCARFLLVFGGGGDAKRRRIETDETVPRQAVPGRGSFPIKEWALALYRNVLDPMLRHGIDAGDPTGMIKVGGGLADPAKRVSSNAFTFVPPTNQRWAGGGIVVTGSPAPYKLQVLHGTIASGVHGSVRNATLSAGGGATFSVVVKTVFAETDARGRSDYGDAVERACIEACMAGMVHAAWASMSGPGSRAAVPLACVSIIGLDGTDTPHLVMPKASRSLGQWLESDACDVLRTLRIVRSLAHLLAELNEGPSGIQFVHGDMHAWNVLIDDSNDDVVYLTDFSESSALHFTTGASGEGTVDAGHRVGFGILDPRTYPHAMFQRHMFEPPYGTQRAKVGYNPYYDLMVLCCSVYWSDSCAKLAFAPLMRHLMSQVYPRGLVWRAASARELQVTVDDTLAVSDDMRNMHTMWQMYLSPEQLPAVAFAKQANAELAAGIGTRPAELHWRTGGHHLRMQEVAHARCDAFAPRAIVRYVDTMLATIEARSFTAETILTVPAEGACTSSPVVAPRARPRAPDTRQPVLENGVLRLVVPSGLQGGDDYMYELADGQDVDVVIPEGYESGDEFETTEFTIVA